jgi:hypothetical protein
MSSSAIFPYSAAPREANPGIVTRHRIVRVDETLTVVEHVGAEWLSKEQIENYFKEFDVDPESVVIQTQTIEVKEVISSTAVFLTS